MQTKGILAYLAMTFALAWGIWATLWFRGISGTDPTFQWLSLPAAFAPALAGFVVRQWITREGFVDVGHPLNLRTHWRYYLFAWFSPLVVTAVIVMLSMVLGVSQPDFSLQRFFHAYAPTATIPSLPNPIFLVAILGTIVQTLPVALLAWGEEFGWRGYLQIRLFANQPPRAAIATGLIWGIWHYPLILLGFQRYENPWIGLLLFPIFTIWLSIIFGWLRLKTGSIWSACLAHGATNAIGGSLTALLFLGGSNWMFVTYNGILAWIPLGIVCGWIVWQDFNTSSEFFLFTKMMKTSNLLVWISLTIVVLALFATNIGLFWQDGGSSFSFTTLRGDTVQIYGQGLYRYDTTLTVIGFKAGDAVTLILGIPALIFSLWLYRRGSVRGGLLLSGTFAYFLYYYGSLAFGAAYNNLFLVYLTLLSANLFGLILVLTSFDLKVLPSHFATRLPRRGIGIYLIVSGVVLISIWLGLSILPALRSGKAPLEVWSYTTVVTYVIDMGIIAPGLIAAGVMLLRRTPLGYLLASILLIFTVILGINLLTAGTVQMLAGLISMGQFIGFVASFAILTLFAIAFTLTLLRNVSD